MLVCMRTTIRLDDQLFADLKKLAATESRPLAGVIEDALRESLARRLSHAEKERVTLPTFCGDGFFRELSAFKSSCGYRVGYCFQSRI